MLCPEGAQLQIENSLKNEENACSKKNNVEGPDNLELNAYKTSKSWKKSITNFFRNQLRSTKSNDGDRPTGKQDPFEEKEIAPEQKWQSLGKVFKRQSFAEHWRNSPVQQGESSSQNKRHAIRKVFSSYLGKSQKCKSDSLEN
ncbi:uncharacterized protein LOC125077965 [Vanessa atalanta]|uniref:uncharacterized protein LOC125077965 n=1 Tax=Vanessa atalanta TaxID=42275 RepID=UPI001FCDA0A6|nr:uncharacterized protein LOC125077965 [Vanessa atalanta]